MAKKQFKGIAKDFINAMRLQFIGKGADPNDIFVQDLYNYEPVPRGNGSFSSMLKTKLGDITKLSNEDRKILEGILSVYNEHITTKRELLTQSRQLFETDIVQTVIDVMIDDGFNSFNDEKEEFQIKYDLDEKDKKVLGDTFQEEVQNVFDEVIEKFSLKARVAEIVPELLRDGEYAWGVLFEEGKGITELVDDMDVIDLLPFYEGNNLSFVIKQPQYKDSAGYKKWDVLKNPTTELPKIYKPDNILFFRLKGPTKKRINMSLFYNQEFREDFYEKTNIKLPKYIRIPLPIYYSAIKNLNRLQLMENVSTVLDLSEVLKPEVITVSVPTNTNAVEAGQIVRDYERQLNESNFTDTDSLDISTLAAQANRRKVLPQWLDSKGTITSTGIGTGSPKSENAWNSVNNLRNLIALSIGIPPFYINIADGSPVEKAQIIKLYSRYTRKLTSLQKTLADGIREFLFLHCSKKGLTIKKENISVKFKSLTSGDALEDTDIMVAGVTAINDIYKGVEEITSSENNNLVFDDAQFKQLYDNLTGRFLNMSDLIRISDNKFDTQEGNEFEDDGFEPSGPRDTGDIDIDDFGDLGAEDEGPSGPETNDAYNDFVNASDDIELEGPQEITTGEE